MIRLFIALEIPPEIRNYIESERKKISNLDLRWEPENKLHMTLKFIGSFQEDLLGKLASELIFVESYNEFSLELNGFGFFRPKILWAGITAEKKLFDLVDDLNKHLTKFNIQSEEKLFKPHLTLLRIPKEQEKNIFETFRGKQLLKKPFVSDKVVLFQSTLSSQGSRYTPLKVFNLRKQVQL